MKINLARIIAVTLEFVVAAYLAWSPVYAASHCEKISFLSCVSFLGVGVDGIIVIILIFLMLATPVKFAIRWFKKHWND